MGKLITGQARLKKILMQYAAVRSTQAPLQLAVFLLELQRDWARSDTYALTTGIAAAHGGGYGLGIIYAKRMFGGQENK